MIEGVVLAGAIRLDHTFHDLHDFAALVLQLLGKGHHRKCLGDQVHEGVVGHLMLALTQRDHAPPGGL